MKYRHSFHAGNFADVHKHLTLLALLRALQRKDKGFLYLDTHAGAGLYDLAADDTHHGLEAKHGLVPLMSAVELRSEALRDYRDAVLALRQARDSVSACPGSPWLAAQALRAQDRGLCCELLPRECRALERALGGFRRMRVMSGDGWAQLHAALPPRERRSLILIDPPYETPVAEFEQARSGIQAALERQANAVIALWYPIKDERALPGWLQDAAGQLPWKTVQLELWLYARDSAVALNGSGMLLINPPYQFEDSARTWQTELHALLDTARRGGHSVRASVDDATHAVG